MFAALIALALGEQVQHFLNVTDPNPLLGRYERTYMLDVPAACVGPLARCPLLMYFHGQGGAFKTDAAIFAEHGETEGYITAAPKGMADGEKGDACWSVKAEGRTDVCTEACVPTYMKSCDITGTKSRCNWATCYDDVHFVRELLAELQRTHAIDAARMYSTGASNGGLMTDYLQTVMPGVFAASVPWYGGLLKHYDTAAARRNMAGVSLLSVHGLKDKEIPAAGGVSADFYVYVSERSKLSGWAAANGCAAAGTNISTPFDDAPLLHQCEQFEGCAEGVAVVYCYYPNQAHGFWPKYAEKLTWWFLKDKVLRK